MNFSLYSPVLLSEELTLYTKYENVEYKVTIRDPQVFDPKDNDKSAMAFMGRFFKILQSGLKLKQLGRRYFDDKKAEEFPMHKLVVWPGYKTSLGFRRGEIAVNIDVCFKVIRQQTVYDFAGEILKATNGNIMKVKENIIGMSVVTTYNNAIYMVEDVRENVTPKDEFYLKEGNSISYMKYYEEKYNRKLKYPTSFLLVTKGRRGKEDNEIHLIPELCVLTGQSDKMKQDFNLQKELNRVVKPKPFQRYKGNKALVEELEKNERTREILKDWQISVSKSALEIDAHKLEAGNLLMGKNKQIGVNDRMLDREIQGEMLNQPELKKVAIFCSVKEKRNAETFKNELKDWIKDSNYPISEPKIFAVADDGREGFEAWKKEFEKVLDSRVQLVVLVLNGNKKQGRYYNECKKLFLTKYPIPCQAILGSSLARNNMKSIVRGVFRQICSKVGGSPWSITELPFIQEPVMLVGIDVFHGKPKKNKSLLGFCATMDRHFSRYWTRVEEQGPGEEIGKGLQACVLKAMLAFAETNGGKFPMKVIVYRDGVGESQGKTLREIEVKAFTRAFEELKEKNGLRRSPDFMFLHVNKSPIAKFFVKGIRQGEIENPEPGTVVNGNPTGYRDFYLISQKLVGVGTANPTQYSVMSCWRNIGEEYVDKTFDMENEIFEGLKVLTNKLCYLYFNYVGAIKVAAPVHYAHVLAKFVGERWKDDSSFLPHHAWEKMKCLYFI